MIFKSRIAVKPFFWLAFAGLEALSGISASASFYRLSFTSRIPWWFSPGGLLLLVAAMFAVYGIVGIVATLTTSVELGEKAMVVHSFWRQREIPYAVLRKVRLLNPSFKIIQINF